MRVFLQKFIFTVGILICLPETASCSAEHDDLIGAPQQYVTKAEDTLVDVARLFDVGYIELIAANRGIDPWLPGKGKVITLPTQRLLPPSLRRGIVINLAELRLYYFPPAGSEPMSFPIGIGSEGDETKLGSTEVAAKRPNPTWFPPPSIRAERPELPEEVAPGPDNPLGALRIRADETRTS